MAGYSDVEIEVAVSRFVQSTIRVEKDALGPVDVSSKFNEVLQLISSTLIYDPNAIFYVIFLATNKLNVAVETAIEYIEDIADAIDELGYHTEDITRTTLLGDAAAALLTVDQILTDKNAISSRAYTRYQQAVDGFTSASLAPNIRQAGQIVRTPQLARQALLVVIPKLSTVYEEILGTLAQIRLMLSEFNGLNLGVVSIQNSVRKVRDDLRTLQTQFENTATTRDDKIALCRAAYLSIASGKSVLNNFTTVSDPSDPRLTSSVAIVGHRDLPTGDDGELVPATLTGTKSGPWEIATGVDELLIAENGAAERTYTFTLPDQPSVINWEPEPGLGAYIIPAGGALEVDGIAVSLAAVVGGGESITNIVNEINTELGAPYTATVEDVGGSLYIKIAKDVPGATEIIMTAEGGNRTDILATYLSLGFYEGQSDSSTGLTAAEAAAEINAQNVADPQVVATIEKVLHESGDATGSVDVGVSTTEMTLTSGTLGVVDRTGDMLLIRSGLNAGYRRIASNTSSTITIAAATPFKVTAPEESWIILSEKLKLTSALSDLDTALEIGAGSLNTVMGFTEDELAVGTTTGFRVAEDGTDVDFSQLDVVEGDIVRLVNDTPSPDVSSEHMVLELASSNSRLELTPPIDTNASISSFRILSAAAVAYEAFIESLEEWDELLAASEFQEDIAELERVMNPLIANKNPSISQLQDARNTLQFLNDLLTNTSPEGLTEILKAFQVGIVSRIDAVLKMLKERGMDRAYELLMIGEIATFFGMDKDDSASSSYMLKTMRNLVQSDLRVSKLDEDADDVTHDQSIVETDPDYDYSDADIDENVKLLGEVPDFDSSDDAEATAKVRY